MQVWSHDAGFVSSNDGCLMQLDAYALVLVLDHGFCGSNGLIVLHIVKLMS